MPLTGLRTPLNFPPGSLVVMSLAFSGGAGLFEQDGAIQCRLKRKEVNGDTAIKPNSLLP